MWQETWLDTLIITRHKKTNAQPEKKIIKQARTLKEQLSLMHLNLAKSAGFKNHFSSREN